VLISSLQDAFLAFLIAARRAFLADAYPSLPLEVSESPPLRLLLVHDLLALIAALLRSEISSDHQYICRFLFLAETIGAAMLHALLILLPIQLAYLSGSLSHPSGILALAKNSRAWVKSSSSNFLKFHLFDGNIVISN